MDEGLKKAVRKQPSYRIPSNFSYKMMEKIRQEELLRECRKERRLYALMLLTIVLMVCFYLGFMIWFFPDSLSAMMTGVKTFLEGINIPAESIPILLTVPLLALFNAFLRKIFAKYR
ncbi:MAG: hypothetical protein SOR57_13145 [Parabacteroides sp.]|nr:hypothetical protein [Parabacteroides sp.]